MIAGLPLASWALLLVAVGLGLGLELAYLRAHRRGGGPGRAPDGGERPPRDPLEAAPP